MASCTSPIPSRELEGLSFPEALERVLSWRPEMRDLGRMLVEGLVRAFEEFVKRHAESASADAEFMVGKPSIFVCPFLSAMQDAVNQGKAIQWPQVFNLCRWVVEQPWLQDTVPYETGEHDHVDRTWQWSREGIARFVSTCCKKKVSFEHRQSLWGILLPLTHEPDEGRVRDQEQHDIRVRDFLDQSLNNPPAYALHIVFEYARWVAEHLKVREAGRDVVPGGFDAMPEVRAAMEDGLQSGEHDNFAMRATYGLNLGLLYWIDKAWLVSRVDQVFDLPQIETEPATAWGWAAWNAFLICTSPHAEYFKLLEKQFKYAAGQYRHIVIDEKTPYRVPACFGEHLIILYGRGQLGLDDHGSMLRRFLVDSSQVIRSHAIAFVGQTLSGDDDQAKEPLPKEVADRFMRLWDWYWPEVGTRDEAPSRDLFGPWYTCGCFDRRWAVERLWQYVERVPLCEHCWHLPEQLAEDAELSPGTALSIVEKMIEADNEGWRTRTWEAEIREILSVAMRADEQTRTRASDLINRLGRKGWVSLGELLRPT